MEPAEFHSPQLVDIEVTIYPFFSKYENGYKQLQPRQIKAKGENHTTRLSPLSFLPDSLR